MADMLPQTDLVGVGLDRLALQYERAANMQAFLTAILEEVTECQVALFEVLNGFDLDDAKDEALDILGRWTGLPRPLIDAGVFTYFGFFGDPGVLGFGNLEDPAAGGRFASLFTPTEGIVPMGDNDYRLNIKAKIIRNTTECRPDDILDIVALVFGDTAATVATTGEAEFTLTFSITLTAIEQALLNLDDLNGKGDRLIPRAAGVKKVYVVP